MEDMILSVLNTITKGKDVKFINLCNPGDKKSIDEAFRFSPDKSLIVIGLDEETKLKSNLKRLL